MKRFKDISFSMWQQAVIGAAVPRVTTGKVSVRLKSSTVLLLRLGVSCSGTGSRKWFHQQQHAPTQWHGLFVK